MKQQLFERMSQGQWETFTAMLEKLAERKRKKPLAQIDLAQFPALYRRICHDLALARDRRYSTNLVDRLNALAIQGHQYLYQSRRGNWMEMLQFILVEYPRLVRRKWKLFVLATTLFYAPLLIMGLFTYFSPETVYALLDAETVASMEVLYDPENVKFGRERDSDTDFKMFGFYIKNNIGIGFQTFAWGISFGIGTIFLLMFNGLYIGAVAGHLTEIGFGSVFYPFVVGHGAFELTAIVLSGVAGLNLGMALLAPGRKSRVHALQDAARISAQILYGAIVMFLLAAFIEAFWSSSSTLPDTVKYSVGGLFWLLVFAYLFLAGRARET